MIMLAVFNCVLDKPGMNHNLIAQHISPLVAF